MSDLNKEALDVWGALKPMIDQEISSRTQGMVQRRKAKVTTAPSLATNTIGVTEAFGDEMFLPFVSNMISAKVGDFVWIEWMYGATNAFVSSFAAVDDKNLTVAGTLDVVQRRCYATLSSAGWYRVLTYTGASDARALGGNGDIYDFSITRKRDYGNNEVHKITLLNPYNVFKFVDESSASNGHFVTKIRVTSNSTTHTKCVDIYYDSTRVNPVTVDFILHSNPDTQGNCVASGLTAVADSPSGETVVTEYTFAANTKQYSSGTQSGVGYVIHRNGNLVLLRIESAGGKSCAQGQYTTVYTLPDWAKPYDTVYTAVDTYGGNNVICGMITYDGNVQIYPVNSTTGYYRFTVTYFVTL